MLDDLINSKDENLDNKISANSKQIFSQATIF